MDKQFISRSLFIGAIVLYLVSLALPGYTAINGDMNESPYGVMILVIGWLGLFGGVYAWYGNPLFVASLFFCKKNPKLGLITATLGMLIGLTAFLTLNWSESEGSSVPNTHLSHFEFGYYLWLASFLCLIAYHAVRHRPQL